MYPFIRKARSSDIDAIVRLNMQLADYHRKIDGYYQSGAQTADGFRQFLEKIIDDDNYLILVAQIKDKITGYFIGTISEAKPFLVPQKTGRISDAFVEKDFRKSGIGRMMFDTLLNWFKEHRVKHLELSVDVRNKIGVEAWKKYGFQEFMLKMKMDL